MGRIVFCLFFLFLSSAVQAELKKFTFFENKRSLEVLSIGVKARDWDWVLMSVRFLSKSLAKP